MKILLYSGNAGFEVIERPNSLSPPEAMGCIETTKYSVGCFNFSPGLQAIAYVFSVVSACLHFSEASLRLQMRLALPILSQVLCGITEYRI